MLKKTEWGGGPSAFGFVQGLLQGKTPSVFQGIQRSAGSTLSTLGYLTTGISCQKTFSIRTNRIEIKFMATMDGSQTLSRLWKMQTCRPSKYRPVSNYKPLCARGLLLVLYHLSSWPSSPPLQQKKNGNASEPLCSFKVLHRIRCLVSGGSWVLWCASSCSWRHVSRRVIIKVEF